MARSDVELFCPATITHLPTLAVVALYGGRVVEMDGWAAYLSYLEARWRIGRGFVNLEHDVEATPAQIDELAECSAPWCGYGAVMADGDRSSEGGSVSFSCTKFGAELIAATRDVWAHFRDFLEGRFPTGDGRWRWDGRQLPWSLVSDWLPWWVDRFDVGLEPHKHYPAVVNARPHHVWPELPAPYLDADGRAPLVR